MFFNEAGIELLLHFEQETRRPGTAPVHRPTSPATPVPRATSRGVRHPAALWVAERLMHSGERLRAWSSPEPVCHVGK